MKLWIWSREKALQQLPEVMKSASHLCPEILKKHPPKLPTENCESPNQTKKKNRCQKIHLPMVPVTFLKKTENFEEHIIAIRKDALHKSLKSRFFSATTHKILGHLKISVAPQPTKKEAHFLPSFPSRLHLHCRVAASYNEVVTVMPNPRTSSLPQCSMAILARWKPCNFLLSTVLLARFLAPFFFGVFWRLSVCFCWLVGWFVGCLVNVRP